MIEKVKNKVEKVKKTNTTSAIAILWTLFAFAVIGYILTKEVKADDKTTYLILTNVMSITMLILGYYFVSSSKNQQQTGNDNPVKDDEPVKPI